MSAGWAAAGTVGAQIAGGLLAADAQRGAIREMNRTNQGISDKNIAMQREFAQNGIRWRVEDAKRSGIHPLYAIGANTPGFSPAPISAQADTSMSEFYQNAGQDIGRAISATQTAQERELQGLQLASARLDLEGKALDNQYRAAQLKKLTSVGPPMPSAGGNFMPGQGNTGVVDKPLNRVAGHPDAPHSEPGAITELGWARTSNGGLVPVPSQDIKERIEDNFFHEAAHFFRNNILPMSPFFAPPGPPKSALPPGYDHWYFNGSEYKPGKKGGWSERIRAK